MNEKVIAYWGIGSGSNVEDRRIQFGIKETGWRGFVQKYITPAIPLGYQRFHLHNPAGTLPNEEMQADQFQDAKEQGDLGWIFRDFVSAWRPITRNLSLEVIAYLGTFEDDFARYQAGQYTKDNYLKRLWESYRYPLDAGMSIGFDAMTGPETDPDYHFMRMLQGLGVKTYIEPWPNVRNPHHWDCNNITTNQLFAHLNPNWAAPRTSLTGEVIILLTTPPTGETWANYDAWGPRWCREFMANGYSVMVPLYQQILRGEPLDQWLERP